MHLCLSMLPLFTISYWILELCRICFFHLMSSISIIFTRKLFIHYTVCTVLKSGWWSDCSLLPKWVIFQLYHCANKLHFNEMMSAVHYTNTLRWILLVISHWNNMMINTDTLSWLQSVFALTLLYRVRIR